MKNIDERLESGAQKAIANLVGGLPDETPSMLWRSGLNEALRAQKVRAERRRRFFWVMRPISLTAACALAAFVFVRPALMQPAPKTHGVMVASAGPSSLEAGLLELHQNDVRSSDVAGTGLNPTEAASAASEHPVSVVDDSEADLEL